MKPSTCACTFTDRRDRTVPTNSLVCSTGFSTSVSSSTGTAIAAPPRPPAPAAPPAGAPDPQAAATRAINATIEAAAGCRMPRGRNSDKEDVYMR
jgi:hypothetical protein